LKKELLSATQKPVMMKTFFGISLKVSEYKKPRIQKEKV
jgi:hypothetical protein